MTAKLAAIQGYFSDMFRSSIYDNPVVIRDFRTRMRGWKAFSSMAIYLILLSAAMLIAFYLEVESSSYSGSSIVDKNVGMIIFTTLSIVQLILLSMIMPAISSGAISVELEKKTVEMLALSGLTGGNVAFGKVFSSLMFCMMLLLSSVPLAGICLMLGGISPFEIFMTYLVLFSWCFLITSASVMFSSVLKKTATATMAGYASSIGFLLFSFSFAIAAEMSGIYQFWLCFNPGFVSFAGLETATICSLKLPLWIFAFVIHILFGILSLLIASTNIKYIKTNKSLAIRLMTIFIICLLTWLLAGTVDFYRSIRSGNLIGLVGIFGGALVLITSLLAVVFGTGVIRKPDNVSVLRYALSVKKIFKNDIGGAISYIKLLALSIWIVYGLTLLWLNSSKIIKADEVLFTAYLGIGFVILAVSFATTCAGIFFSTITNLRRNANGMTILFLLAVFGIYPVILASYVMGISNANNPIWQTVIFWPWGAIMATISNWNAGSMPDLWWPPEYTWLLTTIAYYIIGFTFLAFANKTLAKYHGVNEDD